MLRDFVGRYRDRMSFCLNEIGDDVNFGRTRGETKPNAHQKNRIRIRRTPGVVHALGT